MQAVYTPLNFAVMKISILNSTVTVHAIIPIFHSYLINVTVKSWRCSVDLPIWLQMLVFTNVA